MKNPYLIGGIVLVIAAAAYYFFVYKKKDESEKSSFDGIIDGIKETISPTPKKPCSCPQPKAPMGRVVKFNSNGVPTFRNTGVPCNSGDANEGTWHVNGGTRVCVGKSAS